MVGAEIPLPPNPGEPVLSVPPVGQADGIPLRYRGLGVSAPHIFRHIIYCVRISGLLLLDVYYFIRLTFIVL
jgi:hypothetical protein